jgi:hypothetical protein
MCSIVSIMEALVKQMWAIPALTPQGRRAKVLVALRLLPDAWREVDEKTDGILEIETALRDASAENYLIAGTKLSIVRGMPAMLLTLAAAGVTVEQNRAAVAGKPLNPDLTD